MSINNVIQLGNLVDVPEVRTTRSGGKLATFRLAINTNWVDRNTGEPTERTDYFRVVVFDQNIVDRISGWNKGDLVHFEGYLRNGQPWTDSAGTQRQDLEIVARVVTRERLGPASREQAQGSAQPPRQQHPAAQQTRQPRPRPQTQLTPEGAVPFDDDIPF